MKSYDIVFFDLDGTLADTSPGIVGSLQHTLRRLGLPEPDQENMRAFLGEPIREFLHRVYQLDTGQIERFVGIFRWEYEQNRIFQASLYEGVPKVLKALRAHGIKTVVATNKPQKQADTLVEFFQLTALFDLVLGCDEMGGPGKGMLIRQGIRMLLPGGSAALVGDTTYDLTGAQESGADFISVLYGFGFCGQNSVGCQGAVFAAETPAAVAEYILG